MEPESTEVEDVETTELEISDELRRSGIHGLVASRMPARYRLTGVLCVGLAERRPFTGREVGLFESLAESFSFLLDGELLIDELRGAVGELQGEREIRERFVSLLAHDLRGPLAAAQMSAQLLVRGGYPAPLTSELAHRVSNNLGRIDHMIRDLLDASRVRAGERLTIHLAPCDLGQLARAVADDLLALYGERFVVRSTEGVRGIWNEELLRRALWNLAVNAVKYGASHAPVTISVGRTERVAVLSVHNEGAPISAEDQARLFAPFARAESARNNSGGWGLGLTLVRGCVDAHGGEVSVSSDAEHGTTFTMKLPLDARPFQPASDEGAARG